MKKLLQLSLLLVLFLSIAGSTAYAQLGMGIKLPSTQVFISNKLSDGTLIEIGASISALSNSIISIGAAGKLYFDSVEIGIMLQPCVGVGVVATVLNSAIFFSPLALAGVEYRLPESQLSFFAEVGVALTFGTLGIGIAPGGQIGARFDF